MPMQVITSHRDTPTSALGQRRESPDLARFAALDLNWARAESDFAAPSGGYPSPPMSGSPSLPPKSSQEAGDRSQGSYQTASQDVRRGGATEQPDPRQQQTIVPAPARHFPAEPLDRVPYAYPRPEETAPRPLPYPAQPAPMISQHPYLPAPGHIAAPSAPGYAAASHPPAPESQAPYTSPKSQRKTKGHVASACVPCKRAHLRCDAQRPCSRCLSNGKEDACVDVQHKKRGRPRLRDDRDPRYDPSRYGLPPDPSLRRPLSLYAPQGPMVPAYDDSIRRTQSYRVLKSQPPDTIAPRYIERGSAADANVYPPPLSISTRAPEPAAFLTMDLEISKASSTFTDAVGRPSTQGLKLSEIIVPSDRDKVLSHQRQMQDEQTRKEPNYLPPIYGKQEEERVIQGLGFASEEMARYALDRQEYLTFSTVDGQHRMFPVRMGLAKQDSIYFIVVLLNMAMRPYPHPTPSPQQRDPRDIAYAYPVPQQPYSQPTPVSATFDPRARMGPDVGFGSRPPPTPGQLAAGLSPGLPSSYAASPSRPDYPVAPSYQIPRSELQPVSRAPPPPGYQLPPIRSQQQYGQQQSQQVMPQPGVGPSEQVWTGGERPRVDIGGLLEKPDQNERPQ